jgi:hypothetical protein
MDELRPTEEDGLVWWYIFAYELLKVRVCVPWRDWEVRVCGGNRYGGPWGYQEVIQEHTRV